MNSENFPLYNYKATVVSVYDGDTCRLDIDLWIGIWKKNKKIRLARVNASELRRIERDAGVIARDRLRKLILDKPILLQTIRDGKGKYGRYFGKIFIEVDVQLINVNDWLVEIILGN